ncbi:MAG: aarF [Gammaproteobacteria bacterium]|jgi:ubiquinone biosynthesis protein|nr:aarF [Gammaproteobacteria bacterium]
MKSLSQFFRLFYINYVLARYGIDRVVFSTPLFFPLRFLAYLNPFNWRRKNRKPPGVAIRLALEELGPVFVKFGQTLSVRHDLFSEEIILELQKLQDQVSPFPGEMAQEILEKNYGCDLSVIFSDFSPEPLASASIAQVHSAILKNKKSVVVKIQRPDIKKIIQRDLELLYRVAGLTERFWSHGKRLRPRELVWEFEQTLTNELDFMREAANASQLRRNFLHSPLLYVPEVFWEYTNKKVIVMEKISGIPVSARDAIQAVGVDLKTLAERGVEIFFTQVFRDNFFHADMHPGNIFVSRQHPQNPQYIAVDFGIMGSLSPTDQHYLSENLLAFFKRDYRRVAVLHIESGWVPAKTRVEAFESAIRTVCEPIFERPLGEISFAQLLLSLFQTASKFHMEVQPQLFLLQKTLLHIESLGRQIYPELNLWLTAKPILEKWMRKRYSAKTMLKKFSQQAPHFVGDIAALPGVFRSVLEEYRPTRMFKSWQTQDRNKHPGHSRLKYFLLGVVFAVVMMVGVAAVWLP